MKKEHKVFLTYALIGLVTTIGGIWAWEEIKKANAKSDKPDKPAGKTGE